MLDPGLTLCERCGYDLAGLTAEPACPECGKPVAESLPGHRTGSPWQVSPGLRSWLATGRLMVRHPKESWEVVQPEVRRSTVLLVLNLVLASGAATIGIMVKGQTWAGASPAYAGLFFILAFDLLLVLTAIEALGITFFGNRRKWRISRHVAVAICAHASIGWVIAGAGIAAGWHLAQLINHGWLADQINRITGAQHTVFASDVQMMLTFALPAIGLIAGLLAFEILVYFGMRRMRFANGAVRARKS